MGSGVNMPGISGGLRILSDFRELSFCGPYGPCFKENTIESPGIKRGKKIDDKLMHLTYDNKNATP